MNCKQGDTAIIRRNVLPENIDKWVTCVRLLSPQTGPDGQLYIEFDGWWFPHSLNMFVGPVWLVEALGSSLTVRDEANGRHIEVRLIPIADRDLRPVGGPGPVEDMPRVTDKELVA